MNWQVKRLRNLSFSFSTRIILVVMAVVLISFCSMDPIAQDPLYHNFADQREVVGINNFWNVVTNTGFLVVGLWGLFRLLVARSLCTIAEIRTVYLVFFTGISLVAFGSAYYHLHPTNITLVWDRLPMTIAFMALLVICIAECISTDWARSALFPLLILGQGSVLYWCFTELHGKGDLRPYFLVQFVPVIILPILLLARKRRFTGQWGYWMLLCCYLLGKVAEHYDNQIYKLSFHLIAGHALKHIFIIVGLFALVRFYEHRKSVTV